MAGRFAFPKFTATVKETGAPLAGGKLYVYDAGTTNPATSYTDRDAGTPNANPVILDANGQADIWLPDGLFKLVLDNSADVTQWTVDQISGGDLNTWTISGANIYYNSGNVIIGATTGSETLTVVGTGSFTDTLRLEGDVSLTKPSQNYLITDRSTALAIQSQTSGFASSIELYTKDGDNSDQNNFSVFGLGTPTSSTNTEKIVFGWNDSGPNGNIYTFNSGTGVLRALHLSAGLTNGDQLVLATDGNVGIGTATPDRELEITGAGNVYARITSAAANSVLELKETSQTWSFTNDQGNSNNLTISDSSQDVITMDTDGLVGIGKVPTAYKLEIDGTGGLLQLEGTTNAQLIFGDNLNSNTGIGLFSRTDGDRADIRRNDGDLSLLTSSSSSAPSTTNGIIILNDGNVGIGTASPQSPLNVASTTNTYLDIIGDSAANGADTDAFIRYFIDGVSGTGTRKGTVGYDQGSDVFTMSYGAHSNYHLSIDSSGDTTFSGNVDAATLSTGNETFTYDEGSFTLTMVGITGSPTGTASYVRMGKQVTLIVPAVSGASTSTAWTATGLPASIQASTTQHVITSTLADNGVRLQTGQINITTQLEFEKWSGSIYSDSIWTASGTKGTIESCTISYILT